MVGSVHNCTCALYIPMFICIFPFLYWLLVSADAENCLFIPVYNIPFLPAPGSLVYWDFCTFSLYMIIYIIPWSAGPSPFVYIGSKTTMYPCVITLPMYVHYVLFVPNKPLYVDVFLIPMPYFIHCSDIIFDRSNLSTY